MVKKICTYIHYAGAIGFLAYFMLTILLHGALDEIKYDGTLRLLLYVSFLLILPLWGYKFCHWNEYRRENIYRLITIGLIAVLTFVIMILKGEI